MIDPYSNYLMAPPVVLDADTVHIVIDLGHDLSLKRVCRLAGIQAPERNTNPGKLATLALVEWIHERSMEGGPGYRWACRTHKVGKESESFGRYLATVYAPFGESMTDWLVQAGHAVIWNGKGKKPL